MADTGPNIGQLAPAIDLLDATAKDGCYENEK
jgi:hypothetical protein